VPKYWATGRRRHFWGFVREFRVSRNNVYACIYTEAGRAARENRLRTSLQRCVLQVCVHRPRPAEVHAVRIIYISAEVSFCVWCVCTAERKLMIFRDHAHRSAHDYYNIIIYLSSALATRVGEVVATATALRAKCVWTRRFLNMCAALQVQVVYLDKSVFIEPFESFVAARPLLVRVEAVLEMYFII